MFTTLQAAFGTWPSDPSHQARDVSHPSGLNERIQFGEDADETTSVAGTVFVVRGHDYPDENVFIPPYFVPPAGMPIARQSESVGQRLQDALLSENVSRSPPPPQQPQNNTHNPPDLRQLAPRSTLLPSSHPATNPGGAPHYTIPNDTEAPPRIPSPPVAYPREIQRERETNWPASERRRFQSMISAPSYVNRYRLTADKYARLLTYLSNPDAEPLCEDGSKDHQTKYQAAHWAVRDGRLHRKVRIKGDGAGGVRIGLRRHLDLDETWDVLTAEHLRSGHLGRDRLRKVLERNFIGYTLQEIMFVLRECKTCNGRGKSETRPQTNVESETFASAASITAPTTSMQQSASGSNKSLLRQKQTSNFMFF